MLKKTEKILLKEIDILKKEIKNTGKLCQEYIKRVKKLDEELKNIKKGE